MFSSRIKKIMSAVVYEISLNISSPPPEKWDSPDFKTYMPKSDTIGEEAKFCDSYECSSDISSPPPSGDIPDFEVYTPDSTVDTDDIIDIEEEKKTVNENEVKDSNYEKKMMNLIPRRRETEFESPIDDSDTDPTYDPKQESARKGRRFRSLLTDSSSGSSRNNSFKTPSITEKRVKKPIIILENILLKSEIKSSSTTSLAKEIDRHPSTSSKPYEEGNDVDIQLESKNLSTSISDIEPSTSHSTQVKEKKIHIRSIQENEIIVTFVKTKYSISLDTSKETIPMRLK
ncbi:uncharacterized protein LOC123321591 isoform X2 [Coccinella septempunctata]|uniref:uncharacterized protein LOC123321591 isoform X2 n=1 Tax=Coccinella septempunctata TaxID=41139 RepID=UPI001D08F338|nr:uncharacterized protein LOC123321591 isoform X2 [Coccinella septempunctata]